MGKIMYVRVHFWKMEHAVKIQIARIEVLRLNVDQTAK